MIRSIRVRLLLGTVLGAALVLSFAGVALYFMVRASLMKEFDTALADKARTLATMVETEGAKVDLELDDRNMPEFERAQRPEYLQLWGPDSGVLLRSPSLGRNDLERIGGPLDAPGFRSIVLPDGRPGRLIGITFQPRPGNEDESPRPARSPDGPSVTLVLARQTDQVDSALARLRVLLIVVGSAAVVVSSIILVWVVHGGLRPLRGLASQIDRLGETDLSARVEMPDAPAELAPIAQRLNDLLGRLEAAFNREKAFTADVAHELRTPLAGLRSTLEVSLSRPREADAYQITIQDSLAITHQMQAMVQSLLCLARLEAGQVRVVRETVDVAALLGECWKSLDPLATERGLRLKWQIDPECVTTTDAGKLRQVLQNLLDNAVSYADRGGSLEVLAARDGSRVRIEISNTGCPLSPEELQQVFDRFWRGDAARKDTGVHCGLGLSLVRRIVTLLGGDIRVDCSADGLFRVHLSIGSPSA